jgi:hypothetical protein
MQPPRKARFGCLTNLVLIVALGMVVVFAIPAVFSPWGFFMGGSFHFFPSWQGWGRMHSSTAGDYLLYLWMEPNNRGRHSSGVKGQATLCTPRREKFTLTLGGDFEQRMGMGTDTNGKTMYLYMHTYHVFSGDNRPRFELHGIWRNPDLVMDDHETLSKAFEPDGTLSIGQSKNRPPHHEIIPITLHEGNKSDFEAACAAIPRR